MGLFGGKNSFFNKPLGVGKKSVAHNPTNLSIAHSGGARASYDGKSAGGFTGQGVNDKVGKIKGMAGSVFGGSQDGGSINSLSKGDVESFMAKGEAKGEQLTGATMDEVGAGRAQVRDELQKTFEGNSVAANRLRQSQNDAQKMLKAQQAAGGGGQMNAGQQEALKRQAMRDTAEFLGNEKRQTLSDMSKEFRGAGSDIASMTGQYGSILVGMQKPAAPAQSGGGGAFSNLFGGLF